jgi:hypothetical protein
MRDSLGVRWSALLFLVACSGGPGDAFVAGTPAATSGTGHEALDGGTTFDVATTASEKGPGEPPTTSPVSADASVASSMGGRVPSGADGGVADATADRVADGPGAADGADAFGMESSTAEAGLEPPEEMACGGTPCDEATQFCCVQAGGAESCLATGTACAGSRRECDKASDCPPGNVCCFDFSSQPASASCHSDCGGGGDTRVQACRTPTECLSGTCAAHACAAGGSVESCAPLGAACP